MKLRQNPDQLIIDRTKLRWEHHGYAFVEYKGTIYIGKNGEGHDQLLRRVTGGPVRGIINLPTGRLFRYKDYTVITTWSNPRLNKQFLRDVLGKFKYTTDKVLYEIWDYEGSIFVPFEQLPNNRGDFQSVDKYQAYLAKRNKSMSTKSKTDISGYKTKDMMRNPELYFGKLKQSPDHVIVDGERLNYQWNGYPFLWYQDQLYISSVAGLGHSDFCYELDIQPYKVTKKGRIFQYKDYYILSIWKGKNITKTMLDQVYNKFKTKGDVFFEVYDYNKESESIFVPYQSLPPNQSDFSNLQTYKAYVQKKAKSMSGNSKKNQFYDIQMARAKDIMKNPELYFGKLKQYTARIKNKMFNTISQSGNSVYDRIKFQASQNGYQAIIVRCKDILKNKISVYSTDDLEDAFMTNAERKSYLDSNSKSIMNITPNLKFLYIPQTNVGVIPNIEDDRILYIFENPSSVCDF